MDSEIPKFLRWAVNDSGGHKIRLYRLCRRRLGWNPRTVDAALKEYRLDEHLGNRGYALRTPEHFELQEVRRVLNPRRGVQDD